MAARIAARGLFPVGVAARWLGHPLPDPTARLGEYQLTCTEGRFRCPRGQSPFFLGADPSYEPRLTSLFASVPEGAVIDVGANIGFITVRAARRLQGRHHLVAIEPHPIRFDYLVHNVRANGFGDVTCLNCAVGDFDGEGTIHEPHPSLGPHPVDVSSAPLGGRSYRVNQRSLDSIVDELKLDPVSFVKIDVEGFEPQVIDGMRRLLGSESSPSVAFEARATEALKACSIRLPGAFRITSLDRDTFLATRRTGRLK